jgi:hypothetical protein
MRARTRRAFRTAASAAWTWLILKLEDAGLAALRFAGGRIGRRYDVRLATAEPVSLRRPEARPESQVEAASDVESSEDQPVGAQERERPGREEPLPRKERAPGGERQMSSTRRGG